MNFKKHISLLLIAAVAALCTSCDKFLDIQPVGKVIPITVAEFRSLLSEAYITVPSDRGLTEFRTDQVNIDGSSSLNDFNSYFDHWRWNDLAPDENAATFSWRQFYHVLFIANYVIESEPIMTEGTQAEKDQLVGEALMLRAYMHFNLANLFAPAYTTVANPEQVKAIPLKLDSDVEKTLTRNNLAEVYASILADLEAAAPRLNTAEWPVGKNYRFTTAALPALRSRVLLYMGRWTEARAAAEEAIKLHPTLADPSKIDPARYDSPEAIVALENVMNVQYVRAMMVNRNFYKSFASSDLRKKAYFNQLTVSNIIPARSGGETMRTTLRSAELYLNAAEAAAEASDLAAAREHLLTLQRARYSDKGAAKEAAIATMDREALLAEIRAERTRELFLEGHRWFDLRRNGQPRIEKSYGKDTYVLEQADPRYTLRIPAAAITANPGLAD